MNLPDLCPRPSEIEFVGIDAGDHHLGWRHQHALTPEARAAVSAFMSEEQMLARFSSARRVHLPPFEIATAAAYPLEALLDEFGDPAIADLQSLADVCDLLDARLAQYSLRVPTEDELEAAFPDTLFPWGDAIPDGIPYGDRTSSRVHLESDLRGLRLLGDTYQVELTRTALKLGDGGEAVCGGYPWPMAWLSLSPSFRVSEESIDGLLAEFLETTHLRPVRLACRSSGSTNFVGPCGRRDGDGSRTLSQTGPPALPGRR